MFEKLLIMFFSLAVWVSTKVPTPANLVETFEKGQKLFVMEDYRGAMAKFQEILQTESPFLREDSVFVYLDEELTIQVVMGATYQLGNCYKNLKEYEKALPHFRKVSQEAYNRKLRDMAQFQILSILYDQGAFERVIEEADRLIESSSDSEYVQRAYYNKGWAYYELKRYPEAISAFQEQLDRWPKGEYAARAQYQIAQCYFESGDYEKAIENYQYLIDHYTPKDITQRDWTEIELDKIRERLQIEKGVGRGRQEKNILVLAAKAYFQIGDSYEKLGQPDKAIEAYRQVTLRFLPLQDLVENAFLKIAEVKLKEEGLEAAIQVYRDAIDNSESRLFQGRMQYQIAKLYFEQKEYERALEEYEFYIRAYREISQQVDFTVDEAYYQIGLVYFELGNYQECLRSYQAVLDSFPESPLVPNVLFGQALAYQKLQKFSEAIEILQRIRSDYPQSKQAPLALLQLARIYYDQKELQKAVDTYHEVLARYKGVAEIDSNTIFFELGLCYRDMEQPDQALSFFRKVSEHSPLFSAALSEISEIYLQRRAYQEAEDVLLSAIEATPDSSIKAEIHYYLARLYVAAQKYDPALRSFEFAIAKAQLPEIRQSALFGRGTILFEKGRYPEAQADFEQLLAEKRVNPKLLVRARSRLASIYLKVGQPEKAIALADTIINQAKEDQEKAEGLLILAQVYYESGDFNRGVEVARQILDLEVPAESKQQAIFYLGNCYAGLKAYEETVRIFQKGLTDYPETPFTADILFQLGIVYYNQEDYERAAETFAQFLARFPAHDNRPAAYYYQGYAWVRLGNWPQARSAFWGLVREFPNHEWASEALYQIAEAFYNEGDYQKALQTYERVLASYPGSPYEERAFYNRAWCYVQLKDYNSAMAIFQEMTQRYPESEFAAEAQFTIGDYHYNNRRYREAMEAYQKVIERYPQSPLADNARSLIHELSQINAFQEYQEAMALFDAKEYEKAIQALQKVMERYPDPDVVPAAMCNIAAAYEQMGRMEEALQMYDKIIALYRDSPEHQDALTFAQEHRDWIRENY